MPRPLHHYLDPGLLCPPYQLAQGEQLLYLGLVGSIRQAARAHTITQT